MCRGCDIRVAKDVYELIAPTVADDDDEKGTSNVVVYMLMVLIDPPRTQSAWYRFGSAMRQFECVEYSSKLKQ